MIRPGLLYDIPVKCVDNPEGKISSTQPYEPTLIHHLLYKLDQVDKEVEVEIVIAHMQVVGMKPVGINLKICLGSRNFDPETGSDRQDNRTVVTTCLLHKKLQFNHLIVL